MDCRLIRGGREGDRLGIADLQIGVSDRAAGKIRHQVADEGHERRARPFARPVAPLRGGRGQKREDPAAAELLFHQQRSFVAQRHDDADIRVFLGVPTGRDREVLLDIDLGKEADGIGDAVKQRVVDCLHVRRVVQRGDHQRLRAGKRHGEQAVAVAIERAGHEVSAGVRAGDKEHAAAVLDVLLQGIDARAVDAIDVGNADQGEIVQRTARQREIPL